MRLINKKYLALPGLYRIPLKRKKLFSDLTFFFLLVGVPTSFFALIDRNIFTLPEYFLDLNVLFFFISLIYLFIYFKHLPKIFILPGGKLFFGLVIYLFIQILYSYFIINIDLKEISIIFRKQFFWPIATLGFLLYAVTMDDYRLERFFRWLILAIIIQGILFIISNLINVDFFGTKAAKEMLVLDGTVFVQNLSAVPHYLSILFVFSLVTILSDYQYKKYWQLSIPLLIIVMTVVRSMLIVYALFIFNAIILTLLGNKILILIRNLKVTMSVYVVNSLKVIISILIIISLILVIVPTRVNFFVDKFGEGNNYSYSASPVTMPLKSGNFVFRTRLIEEAFNRVKKTDVIFGKGYIREAEYGGYDFVLGGDTFIAPIIYCEGFVGMIFRLLPILIILILSIKNIFNPKSKKYVLYYISIITLIIPALINIVQTSIFAHYHKLFFVFMLMQIIIHRNKINTIKNTF